MHEIRRHVLCAFFLTSTLAGLLTSTRATSLEAAQDIQQWLIGLRRDLHQIPELGFQETETSQYVRDQLDKLGIPYDFPIAQTGIIGRIGSGTPTVALRADMDALPIQEEVDVPYQSRAAGRMHACGHDTHMTMLLGAARILKEQEKELRGTVLLLFQPAEEGLAGGKSVIESGALEGVAAIHGLHVWPTLKSGVFTSKAGTIMAGSTSFEFALEGRGGHAAMPHQTVDPVIAAAAIVQALQPLVSRETDPVDGAVISVTRVNTGEGATNVIPDSIRLGGTLRGLSEAQFQHLVQRATEVIEKTATAHGCSVADLRWREHPYPPLVNDQTSVDVVERVAKQLVGAEGWERLPGPSMAAEDFSFLARQYGGAFTFLGIRNETVGSVHGLHTSRFLMDESVLHLGAALHADFALAHVGGTKREHLEF